MKLFIVSLIIAVLSGLGVGSGGLLVIYLSLFESMPQIEAQGINLLFFMFAAASSLCYNFVKRHIFVGAVLIMSISGMIGSVIGSYISSIIPAQMLKMIFGGMLVFSGIIATKKEFRAKKHSKKADRNDKNERLRKN